MNPYFDNFEKSSSNNFKKINKSFKKQSRKLHIFITIQKLN